MEVIGARYKYRQKPSRGNNKKKLAVLLLVGLLSLLVFGYSTTAALKSYSYGIPQEVKYSTHQPENVVIDWPETGQAAFGTFGGGVIDSTDNEKVQPIASITKLVTALTILNKNPMQPGDAGEVYTMTVRDEELYKSYLSRQGSVVPVSAGQRLSQYDMLNAMLLPSANNMADSLVDRNFDTMEAYIVSANNLLSSLGLEQTAVADASGFSPNSVSTPSDLILLAREAMKNDVISEIMIKEDYYMPGFGKINNSNRLIGSRPGVVGLKTGTTDEAGYCLLFAEDYKVKDKQVTIIGTVVGDDGYLDLYEDVNKLLNSIEKGFGEIEVVAKGTVVASSKTDWGFTNNYTASDSLDTFGWKGSEYNPIFKLDDNFIATNFKGSAVGTLNLDNSDLEITVIPENVPTPPSYWWKLQNVF